MTSNPFRIIGALLAAPLVMVLFAPGASAQRDDDDDDDDDRRRSGIEVRTNKTAAVTAGDTAWVMVSIRGRADVDDVRFTATLDGEPVQYPENTVDHSGPHNGTALGYKETDYVAFLLTAPEVDRKANVELRLQATWTEDGEPRRMTDSVRVPVIAFTGEPYELVADEVALTEADDGWVRVGLAGLAPMVDDVRVTVVRPADLDIHYPQETFTSLLRDALLEDGETDEANFRLGEAHWGQSIDVELRIDYLLGDDPATRTHRMTITS